MGMMLFSHQAVSNSLWPHGLQPTRLPCPSLSPGICSDSCPLIQGCQPLVPLSPFAINLSSIRVFSNELVLCVRWPKCWIGASASASVLPMNIQDWFPVGWTGWISLQSKGLSRVFSGTIIWKHQFFGAQPSFWSNSHIHRWLLEKT